MSLPGNCKEAELLHHPMVRGGLRAQLGDGHLFLAAANRDARRWEDPDCFDITRRATGHLAFSVGIHGCAGMAVARLKPGSC